MSNNEMNNSQTAPRKYSNQYLFNSGETTFNNYHNQKNQRQNNFNFVQSKEQLTNDNIKLSNSIIRQSSININRASTQQKNSNQIPISTSSKFPFQFQADDDIQFPQFGGLSKKYEQPQFQNFDNNININDLYKQKQTKLSNFYSEYHSSENRSSQGLSTSARNQKNYKNLLKLFYNDQYASTILSSKNRNTNIRFSNFANQLRDSYVRQSTIYSIVRDQIVFKKKESRPANRLSGKYLCKLIGNRIFYKNLSSQSQTVQNHHFPMKCDYIQLNPKQSVSPSLEIDSEVDRLFYFSNTKQQIVILGLSNKKKDSPEICRIKTRIYRQNPILYLISIADQKVLLIIGGYIKINNSDEVEGSKSIQLFFIDSQKKIISESSVINLLNGRIYPLIMSPIKVQNHDSIILIGGNTIGKLQKNRQILFDDPKIKKINKSSNAQGVYFTTKQIIQCFKYKTDIKLSQLHNLTVVVEDKIELVNGYVEYLKKIDKADKILFLLPRMKQLYTMKFTNKHELKIIKYNQKHKSEKYLINQRESYHRLSMKNVKSKGLQFYEINEKGQFQKMFSSVNLDLCACTKNGSCQIM